MRKHRTFSRLSARLGMLIALVISLSLLAIPSYAVPGSPGIYTLDADFAEGDLINVNNTDVPDQLQLDSEPKPFNFIWVAASGRGTIIKIDTLTGDILGEYRSAPDGRGKNPSRTTVDSNGNVWAGNRDEASGGRGSVIHIGLQENGQCVDRNGNGTIETSTGLGVILPWKNPAGVDDNGGVSSAEDECIIHYVRTSGTNARTVAVDAANNVWIGGYGNRVHERYNGVNGTPIPDTLFNLGCGGYGGLIDANNVLWSADIGTSNLLRYDTVAKTGTCIRVASSYGLGIDSAGYIWNAMWTSNTIVKVSPAGIIQPGFPKPTGGNASRGVVVTSDDNVWIANSNSNSVTRLNNNGNLLATIPVGSTPTGVAVDGSGKVWVTNYGSSTVMRIDPATNSVDLTKDLGAGATPYNYSDMTGSTLIEPPRVGSWTIVHDSGIVDAVWGKVTWMADVPEGAALNVTVASSSDGATFGPPEVVNQNVDLTVANGRYLKVMVQFTRQSGYDPSPVLYDLTILANQPPIANANGPYITPEGSSVMLDGSGSFDPDGDALTYEWDLDSDSTFDISGTSSTFEHTWQDGPSYHNVTLRVCDPYGECDTDTATVEVMNVPPTANAGADQTVYRNEVVIVSGSWTDPATTYDEPYSWTWDLTGDGVTDGDGNDNYGATVDGTTSFALEGSYTLAFGVTDKDGGAGSDTVVITVLNQPPVCTEATPSIGIIWPPNHKFVPVSVLGVTDPEGDLIALQITSIYQDEPVDTYGDGKNVPDGKGIGSATAEVRAERSGTDKVPGDGRMYYIGFNADDGHGGVCTGVVKVGVPHDRDKPIIEGGPLYDSTLPVIASDEEEFSDTYLPVVSR